MTALRKFERLTISRVKVLEGEGTSESPAREVNYYFDEAGGLLWNDDRYGPADYGKLSDFPSWALTKVAEALDGQTHNPAIRSLLDAIKVEQQRREVPV